MVKFIKYINLIIFFLIGLNILSAQQLPVFTQYRANRGYINPASVDMDAIDYNLNLVTGASYRRQWEGLESGPTTQTLHGSYRTDNRGVSLLAGGYLINDSADKVGFTGIYGRFAGILSDDVEEYGISAGLTFGGVQYRLDLSGTDLLDPLASTNQGQWNVDVGLGLFAYTRVAHNDYFYGGISVPQTLGLDLTFRTANNTFNAKRVQHYYGLIGYYLGLNEDYHFIEISSWVKYVPNVPLNMDFNLRYHIGQTLWLGAGYGTGGTLHVEAGFSLGDNIGMYGSNIRIGYGFDSIFGNNIGGNFGSTHEVNVTYMKEAY